MLAAGDERHGPAAEQAPFSACALTCQYSRRKKNIHRVLYCTKKEQNSLTLSYAYNPARHPGIEAVHEGRKRWN